MSAVGGKADMARIWRGYGADMRQCLLVTQSGHWRASTSYLPVDASGIRMPQGRLPL